MCVFLLCLSYIDIIICELLMLVTMFNKTWKQNIVKSLRNYFIKYRIQIYEKYLSVFFIHATKKVISVVTEVKSISPLIRVGLTRHQFDNRSLKYLLFIFLFNLFLSQKDFSPSWCNIPYTEFFIVIVQWLPVYLFIFHFFLHIKIKQGNTIVKKCKCVQV